MQNVRTPFLTILFIFLGFFIYTKLFGAIPLFVNSVSTTKTDVFSVTGEGKAMAVPDTANVNFGITNTQNSITSAQDQTNSIINKIVSDLKNLGINSKDIRTTNYSIYPNYNYLEGKQTIDGFTVSANIEVKITPIDKLNQAIDLASRNGANMVSGVQFVLNDKEKEKLEQVARKEAIANAKKKAKALADESGVVLGKFINISESGLSLPPIPMYSATELQKTDTPTQIEPGQSEITSSITLSYELR